MNNLITAVVLSIVSILLANSIFLPIQNIYQNEAYGQGYDVVEIIIDSDEATEQEEEAMEEAEEDDD